MSKRTIIILVIVIALIATGVYFYMQSRGVVSAERVQPEQNVVISTISTNGIVKSRDEANLSFLASGKVTAVNTKQAEKVKKGQLLATIDTSTTQFSAKALKDARDAIIREKDLFVKQYGNDKKAIGGEAEYDLRIRQLDERISQANASYNAQLSQLRNYHIYAPFDGTVIQSNKLVGESASATETIFQIANLDDLYIEIEIDQEDFAKVANTTTANIELDAYPGEIFKATIVEKPTFVAPDSSNDIFKLKLKVNESDKPILLGMTGDVEIITQTTDSSVQTLIFDEVFVDDDDNHFVWILNGTQRLERRTVEIGIEGDIYTEVQTDLSGLTIVIPTDNNQAFEEGKKAKVVEE